MSDALTPQEAQARAAAMRSDPAHPINSLNQEEVLRGSEDVLNLVRAELGPAGQKVLFPDLFTSTPPRVGNPSPGAGVTSEPAPAGTVAAPSEADVYRAMVKDSLVASMPTLNERLGLGVPLDPKQVRAFADALQPRPDGWPRSLDDELQSHPLEHRSELQTLHEIGWKALQDAGLPISVVVEAEKSGGHFSPLAFAFLAELGARIADRQEAAALKQREERLGAAELNDPARRWR